MPDDKLEPEPESSSDAQARTDFVTGIWVCALMCGAFAGMIGWVWVETVPTLLLWAFVGGSQFRLVGAWPRSLNSGGLKSTLLALYVAVFLALIV